jgi:putative methyltransferase (TIGR04325 family)
MVTDSLSSPIVATLKSIVRALTPPIIYEMAAAARKRTSRSPRSSLTSGIEDQPEPEWLKLESWPDLVPAWISLTIDGEIDVVARRVRDQDRQAKAEGFTAPYETEVVRAHFLAFAYVVARVSEGKSSLSVLDFGGTLGYCSNIAWQAAPTKSINYTVQELPAICEFGALVRPGVQFISSEQDLATNYDLVFASGAVQGIRDWRQQMAKLTARANPWLYLARAPVLEHAPSMIVKQKVRTGYVVSWCWSELELLEHAKSIGLELVQVLRFQETFAPIRGAKELPKVRGYLFRSRSRSWCAEQGPSAAPPTGFAVHGEDK